MTLKREGNDFLENLGKFFRNISLNNSKYSDFFESIKLAERENNWFTRKNILNAFKVWGKNLTKENIDTWLEKYKIINSKPKTILMIMPGNIPLVGLHDLICILVTGNKALIKCSSKDSILIPFISSLKEDIKKYINFIDGNINDKKFDAVIATGSNNSVRHFKFYFSNYPSIIRNNKTGVAVITGKESKEDLQGLGDDLLLYFGLGCRNVSKIFIPRGYDINKIMEGISHQSKVINLDKYCNNYNYNKALYSINKADFIDNGFFLLKEDPNWVSPISTAYFEYYKDRNSLFNKINNNKDKIQCIVSNVFSKESIPFGSSQKPELWDYADEIDTVDFLNKL